MGTISRTTNAIIAEILASDDTGENRQFASRVYGMRATYADYYRLAIGAVRYGGRSFSAFDALDVVVYADRNGIERVSRRRDRTRAATKTLMNFVFNEDKTPDKVDMFARINLGEPTEADLVRLSLLAVHYSGRCLFHEEALDVVAASRGMSNCLRRDTVSGTLGV